MSDHEATGTYMNSWEHQTDIETLRIFLENQGSSPATIDRYVQYSNHCLKVLGGRISPRDDCTIVQEELESRMSELKPLTRQRYMSAWHMFVRAVDSGRPEPGPTPYHLTSDFDSDLERYRAWMVGFGYREEATVKSARCVRHCWKLMFPIFGDRHPEDVDEDVIETLDFEMAGKNYAHRKFNLCSLGRFVHFVTGGPDPYRQLTVPERQTDYSKYILTIIRGNPFEGELENYARSLYQRGMRDTTVSNKVDYCMACISRLLGSGWNGRLEDIIPDDMYYLRDLFEDVNQSTTRTYMSTFGNFIHFLTGSNPYEAAQIVWNKGQKVNRVFIQTEEWRRLKSVAEPDEMLVLALGAAMGLRRAEIANLKLNDISEDSILVRGKGHGPNGKVDTMPMPRIVREAMEAYMPMRQRIIDEYGDNSRGHLLIRRFTYASEPIPPDTIGDMIYRLGKRADVEVTTHSLRRLFATTMNDNGVKLDTIRRMMRHQSLDTTLKCYINADPRLVKSATDCIDEAL